MGSRTSPKPARAHGARTPHEITQFAFLLREYRERSGKTQKQLAAEIKMSPSAIGKLERGERFAPFRYSLLKMARALNLSPEEQERLIAAAIQSRPSTQTSVLADNLDELGRRDEPDQPDELDALDQASDLDETASLDAVGYGEAPTEPDIPYPEGQRPSGDAADTTPLAGGGEGRTLTLELGGLRLDVLAALTVSVRWLRRGALHLPERRRASILALVGVALLGVSVVAYALARVAPASAATRPFASADAQGWLVAERQASGLPALLAIMNAHSGAWRPLWPDARMLTATMSPTSENDVAPSLAHPHSPAYSPALHTLAFIASASGGGEAIWIARIARGADGWPAVQPPGPSLAVADCGGCGALAWSPDGVWLLYDTQAGLRALAPATGETRTLTMDAGDKWPACSPDGRWLAYQHGPNQDGGIITVTARDCLPVAGSGAQARYLNGYFPAWRPSWSPDGALLAFTTYASGPKHSVRAVSLKDLASAPSYLSRTPTLAVSQAGCGDPTWARQPSGGEVVVFTCDNPSPTQHHGTVAIAPGTQFPTPWQAVEDTGVNAFQGTCWLPN